MPNFRRRTHSGRKVAANRANSLKSTGPRTVAGKRRVALNARRRDLCPEELERQLRARGEDRGEFCRLHRDLISIFRPGEPAGMRAVALLAQTWWEKARRIRHWVAVGPPRADDLDARLEELLRFAVHLMRRRHAWWQHRLASVLGWPLGSPAEVRRRIESRLFAFGARPGSRNYPRESPQEQWRKDLDAAVGKILAGEGAELRESLERQPNGASKVKQSQCS